MTQACDTPQDSRLKNVHDLIFLLFESRRMVLVPRIAAGFFLMLMLQGIVSISGGADAQPFSFFFFFFSFSLSFSLLSYSELRPRVTSGHSKWATLYTWNTKQRSHLLTICLLCTRAHTRTRTHGALCPPTHAGHAAAHICYIVTHLRVRVCVCVCMW